MREPTYSGLFNLVLSGQNKLIRAFLIYYGFVAYEIKILGILVQFICHRIGAYIGLFTYS